MEPTLAAYVKEAVTIRYDPRDVAEFASFTGIASSAVLRAPSIAPGDHLEGYPDRTLGSPPSASWTDQRTCHSGDKFSFTSH